MVLLSLLSLTNAFDHRQFFSNLRGGERRRKEGWGRGEELSFFKHHLICQDRGLSLFINTKAKSANEHKQEEDGGGGGAKAGGHDIRTKQSEGSIKEVLTNFSENKNICKRPLHYRLPTVAGPFVN